LVKHSRNLLRKSENELPRTTVSVSDVGNSS